MPATCGSRSLSCYREALDAGQAVGPAAALEFVEGRQLALIQCHNDLAAALERDAVLLAESSQRLAADGAIARLGGAGLVVEARVDDAAVVPGLMLGEGPFGLEEQKRNAKVFGERQRRCQPDDAAANDGDVAIGGHDVRRRERRGIAAALVSLKPQATVAVNRKRSPAPRTARFPSAPGSRRLRPSSCRSGLCQSGCSSESYSGRSPPCRGRRA